VAEEKFRNIYFYKDYILKFYKSLDDKVKVKLDWALKLIETIEKIPSKYFKHLEGTDGLI
jgi:hypothetical protein